LTVSISAALLMGIAVFVLCRYAGMRIWHAAVCIMFGFYLASSSLAPDIANVMTSLFRLLEQHGKNIKRCRESANAASDVSRAYATRGTRERTP
jgi:hypothetical protein